LHTLIILRTAEGRFKNLLLFRRGYLEATHDPAWTVSPANAGVTISSTGVVTATKTATAQSYTVTVTDPESNRATATLIVGPKLSLSPTTVTLAQGYSYQN
jgi:hypothetical protein